MGHLFLRKPGHSAIQPYMNSNKKLKKWKPGKNKTENSLKCSTLSLWSIYLSIHYIFFSSSFFRIGINILVYIANKKSMIFLEFFVLRILIVGAFREIFQIHSKFTPHWLMNDILYIFINSAPLGRDGLVVAISVCLFVCLSVWCPLFLYFQCIGPLGRCFL